MSSRLLLCIRMLLLEQKSVTLLEIFADILDFSMKNFLSLGSFPRQLNAAGTPIETQESSLVSRSEMQVSITMSSTSI